MRAVNRGVVQWFSNRQFSLQAGNSAYGRVDGGLRVSHGMRDASVFFRRTSQTAGTFELNLWTLPVFFEPLNTDLGSSIAEYAVQVNSSTLFSMTGTSAQMYGARIPEDAPMGSLLVWEIACSGADGVLAGDLYVVSNSRLVHTSGGVGRLLQSEGDCCGGGPTVLKNMG